MTISRKMFIGYAVLLIVMGSLLTLGSYMAVNQLMNAIAAMTQEKMLNEVTRELTDLYAADGHWDALREFDIAGIGFERTGGLLIQAADGRAVVQIGEMEPTAVQRLGVQRAIATDDGQMWTLYYVNTAVHFVGLFRYAFRDMLVILLALGLVVFIAISLFVSYWLANRLTAPIRAMLPAIDRWGKGKLEENIPITTRDEYATVAAALNDMSAELRRAAQLRKNLTADVAHELRTPLTIVSGKLDYWQQSLKPIQPEELLPLQDELFRLQRLVADLQELSKAEADQLELHKAPADVNLMLARIVEKISVEAEDKGIVVSFASDGSHIEAEIDYNRMTQVLLNLFTNSIRYTPRGGNIDVAVTAGAEYVEIAVSDDGIGIEPEHLPNLFQRFYRTERARSRHSGGTGLGLAIAWEYVNAHRGKITVHSEPGAGTTFLVRLPR